MRAVIVILGSLLVVWLRMGEANDIICGNAVRAGCAGTEGLTRYLPSQEPSSVQPGCFVIADDATLTQSQRTLMQSPSTHVGALFPGNYPCYLKVEAGSGVEMTLAEKQAVDTAQQVLITAQQEKQDELTNNDFCNNLSFTVITDKIAVINTANQTDIAGLDGLETGANSIATITDIATAKALLLRMNNANQVVLNNLNGRYMNGFEKLARCLLARTPSPSP